MDAMIADGVIVDADYLDRPEVEPRFQWLYTSFWKLRNQAADVAGMGAKLSAIAPSEILAWLQLNRIERGELWSTVYEVVTSLDAVYLTAKAGKDKGDSGGDVV